MAQLGTNDDRSPDIRNPAPDAPEQFDIGSALVNAVPCGAYAAFHLVIFWAAVLRHRPAGEAPVAPGHGTSWPTPVRAGTGP